MNVIIVAEASRHIPGNIAAFSWSPGAFDENVKEIARLQRELSNEAVILAANRSSCAGIAGIREWMSWRRLQARTRITWSSPAWRASNSTCRNYRRVNNPKNAWMFTSEMASMLPEPG